MTSSNHDASGAVADFLHRPVAGLDPTALEYRCLRVASLPSRDLARAAPGTKPVTALHRSAGPGTATS